MSPSAPSLHDKLNQLRQRFIDQLPARLQHTVDQWQQSQASSEAHARLGPELHRFFHSLKGTGRSLGFERIALLADQGETALHEQPPAGDVVERVFAQLAEEQQRLQSLPGQQRALAAMASVLLTSCERLPISGRLSPIIS